MGERLQGSDTLPTAETRFCACRRRRFSFRAVATAAATLVVATYGCSTAKDAGTAAQPIAVRVNEAVHTLLYLPLYHAIEGGFFTRQGLAVELTTGGTAANSMAALVSNSADIAIADPMYAPIFTARGDSVRVVGQLVGRIAVWGVMRGTGPAAWTKSAVRGRTIVTHPSPMTANLYAREALARIGLKPERDVKLLEAQPGTEIASLLSGNASVMFALEPTVSIAENSGGRVIVSLPSILGDRVMTGILVRAAGEREHRTAFTKFVQAIDSALVDLRANPAKAEVTARKVFPNVDTLVISRAVHRLVDEHVIPANHTISDSAWTRAARPRVAAGDLKVLPVLSEYFDNLGDTVVARKPN